MAVDPNDRGVNHGVFQVGLLRYRIEQALEYIRFPLIAKAFEDGVPLAERGRKVTPRAAGPRDPQHGLNEPPGVPSRATRIARLSQAERLHLRPWRVRPAEPVQGKLLSELEAQRTWSSEFLILNRS